MIKRALFNFYLCVNMLLCQILFFPWAMPRETISGFFGRIASSPCKMRQVAAVISWLIDKSHWWEPDHCKVTADQERQIRAILYKC